MTGIHKVNWKKIIEKYIIWIIFIVFCLVLSFSTTGFFTKNNIINILRQVSYNGVIACGMTFVITLGDIDLSVGSIVGYAAIVACSFAHPGEYPLGVTIAIALALGAAIGLVNGLGVAFGHVPAFIMTLGTQLIVRGMIMLYNNGKPVLNLSDQYRKIGSGYIGAIPIPVVILVGVLVVSWFMLNKTKFGRHVLALGGNEQAARISGVNTKFTRIMVFVFSGMCAAVAGMIISARVNAGSPTLGDGYELDAIAASVIGGTSMSGGYGSITGTVAGVLIIGVINNGLDLLNVSAYYQQVIRGAIIVGAVLFDMYSKHRKEGK